MIRPRGYKNMSNYFSKIEDVSGAFNRLLESDTDGLFGMEIELYSGGRNIVIITPPSIRLTDNNVLPYRLPLLSRRTDDIHAYEGYLSKPSFLPLYEGLRGLLLKDLVSLELQEDEVIEIQFLFKRYTSDWLISSIDRYKSYLAGNEYPVGFKLGRTIQDKILSALNRMASFDTTRAYSIDVENKIISKVYKFKLGVTIRSKEPNKLVEQLKSILSRYDSHNSISLYKRKLKGLKDEYEERLVMNGENVLSEREIVSLFGGTIVAPHKEEPEDIKQTRDTPKKNIDGVVSLLPTHPREEVKVNESIVTSLADSLKRVGIIKQARLMNSSITSGVRLTVITCDIPKGKTLSQLVSKSVDIQAALGVPSLSITQGDEADTAKFTLPNEESAIVSLRELLEDEGFHEFSRKNDLPFVVGLDEINNPIYLSLTKLVHLMIAGTTGSGKSVFMNTLIVSLMATNSPEMLQFYMIDPKVVELNQYEGMAHVSKVVTDMHKAAEMLHELTVEMEERYNMFKESGVKNIKLYNQKVKTKLPYIVCVIDEYADLHDTNPEVEDCVTRLGQKARAAGIHLVIATQRPDTKVISGRIKANVQNAISFNLNSATNYRTVFGKSIGNITLMGKGDGVMKIEGYPKEFQRFQSTIVSPDESVEEQVYNSIKDYFHNDSKEEQEEDIDLLDKLKKIIAQTRETKVSELRRLMGIRAELLTELLGHLVEEGWLVKHKSKTKGYEISINEEELNKYKGEW